LVDIFDEIAEDLRGERAMRMLRRYGALLLAVLVLVLIAVAAQQFYVAHQARRDDEAANQYLAIGQTIDSEGETITDAQRITDAKQLTDFADDAPAGYASLARLRAAGLYADAGQLATAEALWNQLGTDDDVDPPLRGLANLLWAQHALGSAPDAEVASRLAPLTADANPFHGLARETQALLYLHEGKTDQAKGLFSQIAADPGAPEGVRNRADGLLAKLNG
jgi:hypothetical protein